MTSFGSVICGNTSATPRKLRNWRAIQRTRRLNGTRLLTVICRANPNPMMRSKRGDFAVRKAANRQAMRHWAVFAVGHHAFAADRHGDDFVKAMFVRWLDAAAKGAWETHR